MLDICLWLFQLLFGRRFGAGALLARGGSGKKHDDYPSAGGIYDYARAPTAPAYGTAPELTGGGGGSGGVGGMTPPPIMGGGYAGMEMTRRAGAEGNRATPGRTLDPGMPPPRPPWTPPAPPPGGVAPSPFRTPGPPPPVFGSPRPSAPLPVPLPPTPPPWPAPTPGRVGGTPGMLIPARGGAPVAGVEGGALPAPQALLSPPQLPPSTAPPPLRTGRASHTPPESPANPIAAGGPIHQHPPAPGSPARHQQYAPGAVAANAIAAGGPIHQGSPSRPLRGGGAAAEGGGGESSAPHAPSAGHREIAHSELTLGEKVGEGAFGVVMGGSWRGRAVAVKQLSGDAAQRPDVLEEFRREVDTMQVPHHSRAQGIPEHTNVLDLVGACTSPPLQIVTEFCANGSLFSLLHSPGAHFTWGQLLRMASGAAKGMVHLHAQSPPVLHRDLKSGNLLVDDSYQVKVADFGLSRVITRQQTMTGGLGTFQWMAPEVLAHQRYSEKADVYSFGVVLWEITARQIPYQQMNGWQAAMAVMNRGLRPDIPSHTPGSLAALIRECWAPIPAHRPTFAQIATRLQGLSAEFPN